MSDEAAARLAKEAPIPIRWADRLWLMRFIVRSRYDARFGATAPTPARLMDEDLLPRPLPKTVWLYWEEGWERAPELVKLCARSWIALNPCWRVELLDGPAAEQRTGMISHMRGKQVAPGAVANMVRFSLLSSHGGVWADATTLCAASLDDWLLPLMQSGFFAFARPGRDRLLSTWFLASEPCHPLTAAWLEHSLKYWAQMDRPHLYFWCHHIFADMCRHDRELNRFWSLTPHVSAHGPLELQKHWNSETLMQTAMRLSARGIAVHKLDWRLPLGAEQEALIRRLCARQEPPVPTASA